MFPMVKANNRGLDYVFRVVKFDNRGLDCVFSMVKANNRGLDYVFWVVKAIIEVSIMCFKALSFCILPE